MGYTHYWYRPEQLDTNKFESFKNDCKKIFNHCSNVMGIALGDGGGDNSPVIEKDFISFNGHNQQPIGIWTTSESLSLVWPSDIASLEDMKADPTADKRDGMWFAGDTVSQRVAPIDNSTGYGSGSYETCSFELNIERSEHQEEPLIFDCCKTSYRPYDLTVTAVLIAFKYHFFSQVRIKTDGQEKDWMDGRILCNNLLGYGLDLEIFSEPTDIPVITPKPTHRETRQKYTSLPDICKEIKQTIQSEFKGVKLSATTSHNSIHIAVMEAPEYLTIEKSTNESVNHYHFQNTNFTDYGKKLFQAIHEIILKYHWDESDSMTDYFHCAFYYNLHIGKWDKPFTVKEPTPEKQPKLFTEKPAAVNILDYSEKAIAVVGETKPIKELLKEMGGRFNAFLKCGPGWIFPKTKQEQVKAALNIA